MAHDDPGRLHPTYMPHWSAGTGRDWTGSEATDGFDSSSGPATLEKVTFDRVYTLCRDEDIAADMLPG